MTTYRVLQSEPTWVLDQHPVTIAQWIDVMGADAIPAQIQGKDYHVPVTYITATEADEYARRVGGRLPSDAKLEAAFADRSITRVCPATREWTSTAVGSSRVYRGGGWGGGNAGYLSASYRYRSNPEDRNNNLGLRCARPAKVIAESDDKALGEGAHWGKKAGLVEGGVSAVDQAEGVGISAKKVLTIYVDTGDDYGYGDWQGEV